MNFSSNFWNVANPQNASAAWTVGPGGALSVIISGTGLVQSNPDTTVAGAPDVAYGQSAFGGPSTVTAAGLQLPASVASLEADPAIWLAATYAVDNSQSNIPLNVSYDMFFTAQPATDVASESPKTLGGGLEVMIWTDRQDGLMPAGSGAGLVEQVTLPTSINGAPVTDVAFNVYVGKGGAGTELTTFALADPLASGSISIDLSAALADLALPKIAAADGVSGAALGADYLDSIGLDTEFGPGGTGTETFGWSLSALAIDGFPIIGAAAPTLKGDTFSDGTLEVAAQDTLKLKDGKITVNALTLDAGATIDAKGGSDAASFIVTPIIDNGGLIEAAGGALLVKNAQVNNTAEAQIYAGAGATVSLATSTIEGGTLATATGGAIAVIGFGDTLENLTNAGLLSVHDNTGVTLAGTFDNPGTIALEAVGDTTELIIGNDLTLGGGGSVQLSNSGSNVIEGATSAVTLTNEEAITGAGQLGNGALILVNGATGAILGDDSRPLKINTGTNTVINLGTITATGAGGVVIARPLDNTGKLKVAGGVLRDPRGRSDRRRPSGAERRNPDVRGELYRRREVEERRRPARTRPIAGLHRRDHRFLGRWRHEARPGRHSLERGGEGELQRRFRPAHGHQRGRDGQHRPGGRFRRRDVRGHDRRPGRDGHINDSGRQRRGGADGPSDGGHEWRRRSGGGVRDSAGRSGRVENARGRSGVADGRRHSGEVVIMTVPGSPQSEHGYMVRLYLPVAGSLSTTRVV